MKIAGIGIWLVAATLGIAAYVSPPTPAQMVLKRTDALSTEAPAIAAFDSAAVVTYAWTVAGTPIVCLTNGWAKP